MWRILNKGQFASKLHQSRNTKATLGRHYRVGPGVFGYSERVPSAQQPNKRVESTSQLEVQCIKDAYRRHGFLLADLDPLKLWTNNDAVPELDLTAYGLSPSSTVTESGQEVSVEQLTSKLQRAYCSKITAEFMHLLNTGEREWFAEQFESTIEAGPTKEERLKSAALMIRSQALDKFLSVKFPMVKRYSGEGAESAIPFYYNLLEESAQYGVKEVIWGGAHRGRLSLHTVLFEYPVAQLFRKMRGKLEFPEDVHGSGDVLTHNTCHFDYATPNGTIHVSTIPNPSHLEVPTPMAVGKARGRARSLNVGDYAGGRAGDGQLCGPVSWQ
ncbi:hypothetical protein AAVH_02343 [Aphelenchoides avenae]|nr:hypothetical protein AAVH_02343 [Aphelenchus avenae]